MEFVPLDTPHAGVSSDNLSMIDELGLTPGTRRLLQGIVDRAEALSH